MPGVIPAAVHDDVDTLWTYHRLGHELRHTEVGIGLGSHNIGVAVRAAELYKRSLFSLIVFTGANAPTTVDRFPRGEAVHYRERALEEGVPDEAIRVEPKAGNTGENMTFTRDLLSAEGLAPKSVMLSRARTRSAARSRPAASSGPRSRSCARPNRSTWTPTRQASVTSPA